MSLPDKYQQNRGNNIVAYVDYIDKMDADKAVKFMNHGQIDGQVLFVNTSHKIIKYNYFIEYK